MGSLFEELEAPEAAAQVRVEELESQIAELTARLEAERETVAEMVAEMSSSDEVSVVEHPVEPTAGDRPVRVVGAIMVPHWREGLSVDVLPDVYRDIVADASDPMQAKRIVPRIGLPAATAKIEGTLGKLNGWRSGAGSSCRAYGAH
ncbi:hypothetical protein BN159_8413 [Streptomyces davaonensis JCM 4913]|uniref:Uncharacterized protein n=1 Tax=Streptomyces davaonensis (strain DSM 101723 / JCM 4913 / KCC S-0913 / 768) TaxID=1214101 RepID=K4R930_STRDJ|nr:hypothetical protein [Streptomyces davaonensis]CCK32791.1 hypothetical protein BN159_8413 [Streptomyces davaonensis JCM 4913]